MMTSVAFARSEFNTTGIYGLNLKDMGRMPLAEIIDAGCATNSQHHNAV